MSDADVAASVVSEKSVAQPKTNTLVDVALFVLVTLTMSVLSYLQWRETAAVEKAYEATAAAAITWHDAPAALMFARARDYAVIKSSAIFMGYILSFVGCLYV